MQVNGKLEARVRDLIVREMLQGEDSGDLTPTTELVDTGIVDSINVLKLVDFVEETYAIELEPEDIRQFTTISNIVRVVESKAGQDA
jgi:acyl carrier protein